MEPMIIGYVVFFACFVAGIIGYVLSSRPFRKLSAVYENPEALGAIYAK